MKNQKWYMNNEKHLLFIKKTFFNEMTNLMHKSKSFRSLWSLWNTNELIIKVWKNGKFIFAI